MPHGKPPGKAREQAKRPRNIRLTLAFDGAAYHGWQIQRHEPTIQGVVREAIRRLTGETVVLTGCGRTDAGTHARAFVANFISSARIPLPGLVMGLNSLLPRDIRILSARQAPPGFHSRLSAESKVYRYQIYRGKVMPPHLAREYYHYTYPLDLKLMVHGASLLEGEHDFASLAALSGRGARNTVRHVFRSELARKGRRLWFTVAADGFLHHMVRNMAGTLLELGRGRMSPEDLVGLFKKRDRDLAGLTVPAHGLILLKVRYRR